MAHDGLKALGFAMAEQVVAARKAALKAKHCSSCEAVLEDGDAFCRACGTKVTA